MKWDDLKRESFRFLEDAALLVVFVVVLYLLVSCRSVKYVPVETVRTDTAYITRHEWDSIFVHDSVHTKESQKGDTIFVEVRKWRTKYVERQTHDTLYVATHDSVPVPVPVERELTRWERTKMDWGGWAMGAVAAGVMALIAWIGWRRRWPP